MGPDDLRSVRPFQVIVYLSYIVAGVQAAALGAPPGAVREAMGHEATVLWIVMLLVFPSLSLAGLASARRWAGSMWLQLGGNVGVAGATAAYAIAVIQSTWWNSATFAAWLAASLTLCCLVLVWGDVRRIVVVERRIRRIVGGEPGPESGDARERVVVEGRHRRGSGERREELGFDDFVD